MKTENKSKEFFTRAAMTLLVMMLTATTAWAEDYIVDDNGNYWYYTYDSETNVTTLTKYYGKTAEVTTPTQVDGHPVTVIGTNCFANHSSLQRVTISDGVVSIGFQAFFSCTGLESVIIPASVRNIEESAFSECSSLPSITLPNGLEVINQYSFSGCTSLASVTIPVSITTIGKFAFASCTALKSITIPNSVTTIGNQAFNLAGLENVYFEGTYSEWLAVTKGEHPFDDQNDYSNRNFFHWLVTVTFETFGIGTAPAAQTYYSGIGNVTRPEDPTATGYEFGGWYGNAACTAAFDFDWQYSNLTVYAKWTALENTITFDLGGRGSAISNQTVTSGGTVTEPAVQFDGADGIEGWYTDAGRTQKYDFTTEVDHSMTLYAKWAAAGTATINVTNGEGGTATLTNAKGQVFADGKVMPGNYTLTVTPNSGYSFNGSYTLTNRSNSMSDMPYEIVGSGKKTYTYTLDLTEKDAAVNVTFSTQPILTVTTRAADESVLSQVTWSVKNNQNNSNYSNGSIIPYISDPNGAVASDFGIRLSVNLGTLSGYAFTATVTDRGNGSTTKYNSLQGTSFLIQPYGSIEIDLYVYEIPAITLQDNADNSTTLAENVGIAAGSITLEGRTLYKDGKWNTLCLPFAVSSFTGTPLEGATVMSLRTTKSSGTGFDSETGVLTLNFTNATSITAGKAYIVKWDKPADYEGNESTYDIIDPTFADVTISSTAPSPSTSNDKKVSFTGCYSPVGLAAGDKSVLFLGGDNTLYWPSANVTVKSFRAYFTVDLSTAALARAFVLNFGEDGATGIHEITDPTPDPSPAWEGSGCAWYTLDGVRLSGQPTAKGIYINRGRKVVIK